jgi:hypothetical protein
MAKSKLKCCIYCGRDTTDRHGMCQQCLGMGIYSSEYRGRPAVKARETMMDYEDDYSEESGPDSVHGAVTLPKYAFSVLIC